MPSQEDFHKPRSYRIIDREIREGELKTRNPTNDPVQRHTVTSRGDEDSAFTIAVDLVACIHGFLEPDRKTPASLIILEYEIHAGEDDPVVKAVKTSFTFQNALDTANISSTQSVAAYAPNIRRYNQSTGDITRKKGFEAGGGVDASPAKLDAKYTAEHEQSHTQHYFEKVESGRRHVDRTTIFDKVWWRFRQNKSQKLGVTPAFRTAILLTRNDQARFIGNFKIKLNGGVVYNFGQALADWCGRAEIDEPIIFDPLAKPFGMDACSRTIDPNALQELTKGKALDKGLAPLWGVDWGE